MNRCPSSFRRPHFDWGRYRFRCRANNVFIGRILSELLAAVRYAPVDGSGGGVAFYPVFFSPRRGVTLDERDTLDESGILDGDVLLVVAERYRLGTDVVSVFVRSEWSHAPAVSMTLDRRAPLKYVLPRIVQALGLPLLDRGQLLIINNNRLHYQITRDAQMGRDIEALWPSGLDRSLAEAGIAEGNRLVLGLAVYGGGVSVSSASADGDERAAAPV